MDAQTPIAHFWEVDEEAGCPVLHRGWRGWLINSWIFFVLLRIKLVSHCNEWRSFFLSCRIVNSAKKMPFCESRYQYIHIWFHCNYTEKCSLAPQLKVSIIIWFYSQMWLKDTLMSIAGIWLYRVWCCWIKAWRNSYKIHKHSVWNHNHSVKIEKWNK